MERTEAVKKMCIGVIELNRWIDGSLQSFFDTKPLVACQKDSTGPTV